jgi:hypothetical protein
LLNSAKKRQNGFVLLHGRIDGYQRYKYSRLPARLTGTLELHFEHRQIAWYFQY